MSSDISGRVEWVFAAPLATRDRLEAFCAAARGEGYRSVSIPGGAILLAQHFLADSGVKISCRIGFPHGGADPDVKRFEAECAIDAGAHEIEVVPALARIADGEYSAVLRELRDVVEAADERPVKVTVEPAAWTPAVLNEFAGIILDSGARYVSLISGPGAAPGLVRAVRDLTGPQFGVIGPCADVTGVPAVLSAGASLAAVRAP